jgi:hypothetical protein
MSDTFPSLITPDTAAGLVLAGQLAGKLHAELAQARSKIERPGGMNFLEPRQVPREFIAAILFYAIASANQGWADNVSCAGAEVKMAI